MTDIDATSHHFAGYRVVHDAARADFFGPKLPEWVTSVSDCIVDTVPNVACLAWTKSDDDERLRHGQAFGLGGEELARLVACVDACFDANAVAWPGYVQTDEALEAIVDVVAHAAHAESSRPLRVVGLGLHSDLARALVERFGSRADVSTSLIAAIQARRPMPANGALLGFEPMCWDHDGSPWHSWLCNGLVEDFVERSGATPNALGLIDDFDAAAAFCRIATDEQLGEPGLWLPWLLVDYTARFIARLSPPKQ